MNHVVRRVDWLFAVIALALLVYVLIGWRDADMWPADRAWQGLLLLVVGNQIEAFRPLLPSGSPARPICRLLSVVGFVAGLVLVTGAIGR